MPTDAELVRGILAGDPTAFEQLYEKYKGPVYRTAVAVTRDVGTAEEVLQDCFLRAHRYADRIDVEMGLLVWLHRIALNLAYNRLSRKRFLFVPIESVVGELTLERRKLPEEIVEQNETVAAVLEAVESLSLNHRAVVVLYYLQDFRIEEMAYILNVPVGTVKSRLHYALKKLRKQLIPYGARHWEPSLDATP